MRIKAKTSFIKLELLFDSGRFSFTGNMLRSLFTTILATTMIFAGGSLRAKESICYGTTKNGRLEQGVKMPAKSNNFAAYSTIAGWLGRTFVHSKVRDVVVDAYRLLETEQPQKVFKYAETGYKEGGQFKPHKTHQNGLSVDFIVPVVNENNESVQLPTNEFNKYGYAIEFDSQGKYKSFQIDYEALGAHIVTLHKAALNNGIGIWRVIFDPRLQPKLYASKYGSYIKQHITIPKKKSWVRHDDHYHVDFAVDCKPLR